MMLRSAWQTVLRRLAWGTKLLRETVQVLQLATPEVTEVHLQVLQVLEVPGYFVALAD